MGYLSMARIRVLSRMRRRMTRAKSLFTHILKKKVYIFTCITLSRPFVR